MSGYDKWLKCWLLCICRKTLRPSFKDIVEALRKYKWPCHTCKHIYMNFVPTLDQRSTWWPWPGHTHQPTVPSLYYTQTILTIPNGSHLIPGGRGMGWGDFLTWQKGCWRFFPGVKLLNFIKWLFYT